jgi:DNA-binding NarL/FixJ family response regulator
VPKHAGRETLRGALESLARGETFVTDGQLVVQQKPGGADALARLSNLTRQQGRILELICQGKQNKQIAWELTIAETTVKAHVTAIMRKLGVQTRTQAVLLAQDTRFKSLVPEA